MQHRPQDYLCARPASTPWDQAKIQIFKTHAVIKYEILLCCSFIASYSNKHYFLYDGQKENASHNKINKEARDEVLLR